MVIVYKSNTGFTKAYAELLSRVERMELLELSQAKSKGLKRETDVFYMGPLMAGHIGGIDQAVKCFEVKGACGVGMSPPGEKVLLDLSRANYMPDGPIFYLQGGYAPEKVGWLKRRMVNAATKSIRESLLEKGSRRTPEEQAQLDLLLKGGSFVAEENLDPIRNWMKERGR
ncbi:MAG: hypothetical protein VB071_02555 [Lawsonibacter sp.]|nr:hypothetical protein [Lawsonibacter sp.]